MGPPVDSSSAGGIGGRRCGLAGSNNEPAAGARLAARADRSQRGGGPSLLRGLSSLPAARNVSALGLETGSEARLRFLCQIVHAGNEFSASGEGGPLLRAAGAAKPAAVAA